MKALKELCLTRKKAEVCFLEARDWYTKACNDLSHLLLEQKDYWNYMTKNSPAPEWVEELPHYKLPKKKATRTSHITKPVTKKRPNKASQKAADFFDKMMEKI